MDLIRQSAREVVRLLSRGDISPLDCLDALEVRIGLVNRYVNALPTLCFDRARRHAQDLMAMPPAERGVLFGLPVPIKDLANVAGVRSTQGSPIYADHVPEESDLLVTHLEANGGIVYAMSNTPEFGAGANTFNEVFGRTFNPWNLSRSAAGSSGGAAAALATGMAWAAHGSDMGGSLRNPASFCGVVGLRPSPGRVASTVSSRIDGTLSVEGPMARDVEEVALLLEATSSEEGGDPLSLPAPATSFLASARSGWRPRRVAVSRDLGVTPVDREVADIVFAAARRLEEAGVIVEEAHPDLSEAHDVFDVLRALSFATFGRTLLDKHRDKLKADVAWNIERGLALTGADIARAEAQRGAMFQGMRQFFGTYDLLLCPATIVPPFPVDRRYVAECDGHEFENYYRWLAIAYAITNVACPAISIPAGFTADDLPVGIQIVAPGRGEAKLLAGAKLLEDCLALPRRIPIDPRPGI
ncbi:amidase family protein [soil metagenome]